MSLFSCISIEARPREPLGNSKRPDDLTEVYSRARVFVAPLRYASGLPFKVHEAGARGVPTVLTPLLADQLGWSGDEEVLAAESPEDFAEACLKLHSDRKLWKRLRARALARVRRDCSRRNFGSARGCIVEIADDPVALPSSLRVPNAALIGSTGTDPHPGAFATLRMARN
jgi:Glycosyl transferases group 1